MKARNIVVNDTFEPIDMSISPLANLHNLKKLHIRDNPVKDYSPLGALECEEILR